jgi:L-alanine-DL-glutamate epimerase-like enolase superfamily enzyme
MPASHAISRGARELLVGEDASDPSRLWRLLFEGSSYYGRSALALHVVSAIDIALWDIAGKAAGKPVCELLGGRPEAIRVYASEVMPETPEGVRAVAQAAVDNGYGALKLGWGPLGRSPGLDEELIRAARETIGPERALMIDGGQRYTVEASLALLDRVSDVGLYWLEEPLEPDDYDGYRRLSDTSQVRIAAGEADATFEPFRRLVELGGVAVLQPDVSRCGGFTVAQDILRLAAERHVEVVPHCFSTGVLVAASLHMAAGAAEPTYSEFSVADSPLAGGLLTEPFELDEGRLAIPDGPGLGIDLDDEAIERLRVR